MSAFNVALVNLPSAIKTKVCELSRNIEFAEVNDKGGNGYLLFGKNRVTGKQVAVKFYYWGGNDKHHTEPQRLAAIRSPYVISILDVAFVDFDYAYFVTPFCENGDVEDLIARGGVHGNKHAVALTRNVLSGVVELHAMRFVHRDLKAANILLGEKGRAMIGDFGSVKALPEGAASVTGSAHSDLYRPPEAIASGCYGFAGDIYQVGIFLYQVLGGYLPYDETAWLSARQKIQYLSFTNDVDRRTFGQNALFERIGRGSLLDLATLPSWVCTPLRKAIRKACHPNPESRFQSATAFLAHVIGLAPLVKDWQCVDGLPTLVGQTSYRICLDAMGQATHVEKKAKASWRRDNRFGEASVEQLVKAIEGIAGL